MFKSIGYLGINVNPHRICLCFKKLSIACKITQFIGCLYGPMLSFSVVQLAPTAGYVQLKYCYRRKTHFDPPPHPSPTTITIHSPAPSVKCVGISSVMRIILSYNVITSCCDGIYSHLFGFVSSNKFKWLKIFTVYVIVIYPHLFSGML